MRDTEGTWLRDLPVVRVAINRPEVRNAFRPRTVDELYRVLDHARTSGDVGAVILTGNGPSPRDGAGPSPPAATSESADATATSTSARMTRAPHQCRRPRP
ncbi:enoyl-CoA hydratase-related protein [Actinomyces lilanjuaniae]|uniref:enoyl-CoA hydratase-related protein n=1 Tax=Actinomyces lilanjuaniae TaxID=2321394 RepID=UPI001FAAA309|nr:enoyl-CoA hydratase-related protein [Actinomyces lilanjuaniae]